MSLSTEGVAAGYELGQTPQRIDAVLWGESGIPRVLSVPEIYDSATSFSYLADGSSLGVVRRPAKSFGDAAVWNANGSLQILPKPNDRDGSSALWGAGNIIVGHSFQRITIDNEVDRLMVWENRKILAEITFPGANNVTVYDINASGTYVGWFNSLDGSVWGQFIGQRDQARVLSFPGYRGLDIAGINDSGHFVGSYTTDNFQNYMGYISFDGVNIIELPPAPGFTTSAIRDNNNAGEMVGVQWDSAGRNIASYYPPGSTTAIDMNTLINPIPNVKLVRGIDINNRGQILVEGETPLGYRYYVLTPIPEPAGAAIIAWGITLLARRRG